MAVGRAARRAERTERVGAAMGAEQSSAALDLIDLMEYAWHDCYQEITPGEQVVDDILTCAEGDLGRMIHFALLAVVDSRDLHLAARLVEDRRKG
ncbi:hypothetical protein [Kitasatospora sp. NPDC088134]|uniref:hypothetical protein n=1 Tax=Kitasatospora sp. NPDC088134 TaxID=3364071 RepID=UPI003818BF8C